ncbi:MAG: hypothetical protein ACK4S0_12400, partial [Sediminibacterium sp.]
MDALLKIWETSRNNYLRFIEPFTLEQLNKIPEGFNNDEAKVVPLSLQLLLENCIKHNVVSEAKPLHVKISIEN